MKSVLTLLLVAAPLAASTMYAQTAAAPAAHHAASTAARAASRGGGCAKLPELSPKIPALPPGASCPRALYTITTVPSVRLEYASPLESPGLRERLGLEPTSFSLDYVDTKIGTGELAEPHKWYTIQYTGYLTDGAKFDSSRDRNEPFFLEYGQHHVIPGWDTGFDGMRVGGRRRLFIPYQLAYGPNGRPPTIPGKAELIFDVELLAQSDKDPTPPEPAPPAGAPQAPGALPGRSSPYVPVRPPASPPPATPPQR